jgi:sulfonate transport system substrate-binding protein
MSLSPRRLTATVALLAATGTLAACGATSAATTGPKPLSGFDAAVAAKHPQWSKYTFVIGDNGGDGSQVLSQITGVFEKAPYKVTFARFTYGPPLVQAAASGDIDLGVVGDVPPITGAASEYGFSVVGVAHYINTKVPEEDIIVPKGSPIHSLKQLKARRSRSRRAVRRTACCCWR